MDGKSDSTWASQLGKLRGRRRREPQRLQHLAPRGRISRVPSAVHGDLSPVAPLKLGDSGRVGYGYRGHGARTRCDHKTACRGGRAITIPALPRHGRASAADDEEGGSRSTPGSYGLEVKHRR